ncbi:hypothetical protein JCM16303_006515 [Sporobolomyces ruberrimus]
MQTPERSPSPVNPSDEFLEFPPPQALPFPPGVYTLLPLVDKADNGDLPHGPWEATDLRKRWEQHVEKEKLKGADGNGGFVHHSEAYDSSAVDDDEDEEEQEGEQSSAAKLESEFIVPFFVQVPEYSAPPPATTPTTPRRRSSASRSASFTPMTTIPSLRPSSPTSSNPTPQLSSRSDPSIAASQPVGFLRPAIVLALLEDNQKMINMNLQPVWKFLPPVSFEKIERRPSYGSKSGSRRHSIKSLTSKPTVDSPTSEEPPTLAQEHSLPFSEIVNSLRALELGRPGSSASSHCGIWAVGFADWINGSGEAFGLRNEHLDRVVRGWKMSGQYMDQLAGWRDEVYNIYGPGPKFSTEENPLPGSNVAFRLERAACSLFGVTTFGVHCTAYVDKDGEELKIWVPRRSATKATQVSVLLERFSLGLPAHDPYFSTDTRWPSCFDNTVAGGITAGDLPRQSILREFSEEASLPPQTVSPLLRQAGVITYVYRQRVGWLQPEVQYVYDVKLPSDNIVKPTTNPADGEVESFELMGLEQVVQKLVDGEFKPNCALVLIDFFIRHGLLTAENDVRYLEVSRRIHRELGLPGPV